MRWAHIAQHLRNLLNLRESCAEKDARLERKLRYEFAKLKTRRKQNQASRRARRPPTPARTTTPLRYENAPDTVAASGRHLYATADPFASLRIDGKRERVDDPAPDAQNV